MRSIAAADQHCSFDCMCDFRRGRIEGVVSMAACADDMLMASAAVFNWERYALAHSAYKVTEKLDVGG